MLKLMPYQVVSGEPVTELTKPEITNRNIPPERPPIKELTAGEIMLIDALSHSSGQRATYPDLNGWKLNG